MSHSDAPLDAVFDHIDANADSFVARLMDYVSNPQYQRAECRYS